MDDLHKKILTALCTLGDVVDGLDEVPETQRITGIIVSSAFDDLDHAGRQKKLWSLLNPVLTPDEARRVGPIATLTLDEASIKTS